MKSIFVRDLQKGRHIKAHFLVRNKSPKVTRAGDPYLDLDLQDSTGTISAKMWDCSHGDVDFEVDDIVQVSGVVEDYQESLQLRIEGVRRSTAPEIDLRDFLPSGDRDPELLFATLIDRARRTPDGPLRTLLLSILEDPAIAEKYKLAPAATTYHHAYLGGLLEHVVSLLELADRVCDHYDALRRDLVLAGVILHDLGKIEELQFSRAFRYTTRGQLVGHIAISLEMVRDKMRTIPDFPPALKDEIEHIILSHHGRLEFGSPKEPMFPEALVVHYLDDMDSKLGAMRAQYEADREGAGDWTARNPALRRELLKPQRQESKTGGPVTGREGPKQVSRSKEEPRELPAPGTLFPTR